MTPTHLTVKSFTSTKMDINGIKRDTGTHTRRETIVTSSSTGSFSPSATHVRKHRRAPRQKMNTLTQQVPATMQTVLPLCLADP